MISFFLGKFRSFNYWRCRSTLIDVIGKEVLEAKVDCNAVPSTVDCEGFDVTSTDEPINHIMDYKML